MDLFSAEACSLLAGPDCGAAGMAAHVRPGARITEALSLLRVCVVLALGWQRAAGPLGPGQGCVSVSSALHSVLAGTWAGGTGARPFVCMHPCGSETGTWRLEGPPQVSCWWSVPGSTSLTLEAWSRQGSQHLYGGAVDLSDSAPAPFIYLFF